MSLSRIHSAAFLGLDAVLIEVEVDAIQADKTVIVIVGLPDTMVRESKDRVMTAIKNSGFSTGFVHCIVNLAPGDLKKEGTLYDLPIALGILKSKEIIKGDLLSQYIVVGELGLSGEMRPIHGALSIAILARNLGKKGVILPACNAHEAAAVPGVQVVPVHTMNEAIQFLSKPEDFKTISSNLSETLFQNQIPQVDFSDIKGQAHAKRAMEIAVAGNHNIILSGPPGSGKTMIAKALVGIMPDLTIEEALETTKIHSIAGLLKDPYGIVRQRPFRSPHHTISYAGLIGGGASPRPGEVSLAHNGILFLDELPEFSRLVLEVLRQPLEDGKVTISRANGNFTFPTHFMFVAAMNPCPCGLLGSEKTCTDTLIQIDRYRGKISGPLWDRIDMHVEVPAIRYSDLAKKGNEESSFAIKERIKLARERQKKRFGKPRTNAQMTARELKEFCSLDPLCEETLRQAIDLMGISARASSRLLKVALTIADLTGVDRINNDHLMEALHFRGSGTFRR